MEAPNIAGFKEAQSRLRNLLGTTAIFHVPGPVVYPPGTPVDPQTGRPYDPTIKPTSEPITDKPHKVAVVVARPSGRGGEVEVSWAGLRYGDSALLEMDDAVAADVQAATTVTIKGMNYKISQLRPDPGLDDRWLATVELK